MAATSKKAPKAPKPDLPPTLFVLEGEYLDGSSATLEGALLDCKHRDCAGKGRLVGKYVLVTTYRVREAFDVTEEKVALPR